jgi:hypothetical protein
LIHVKATGLAYPSAAPLFHAPRAKKTHHQQNQEKIKLLPNTVTLLLGALGVLGGKSSDLPSLPAPTHPPGNMPPRPQNPRQGLRSFFMKKRRSFP